MTAALHGIVAGSALVAGDGRRIVLGKLVKAGGAGAIHRVLGDPAAVAKIYHFDQRGGDYEHRVAAMLALRPRLPYIDDGGARHVQLAWPLTSLRDARGTFVGFLMPTVDVDATAELEMVLQEKQARAHGLPTGLGAKITLAANLAAVIAALHSEGHHVVDMKPVNLRFYPRSLYMAMLDCDGFGIAGENTRFAAPQFTPDYLAPEFQRGGLTPAGEEAQDRFALAVIVFQLLNFGLHPYSGRPLAESLPTDIPGRIALHAYPYGLRANAQIAPGPVSGHLAMPAALRQLFDRAFCGAHRSRGGARPSAAEWAGALRLYAERARGAVVVCVQEATHQHFAGQPCAACARTALIAGARRLVADAAQVPPTRHAGHPPPQRRHGSRPPAPPPPPKGRSGRRRRPAAPAAPPVAPAPVRAAPPPPPRKPWTLARVGSWLAWTAVAAMYLTMLGLNHYSPDYAGPAPTVAPAPGPAAPAPPPRKPIPARVDGRIVAPYLDPVFREDIDRAIFVFADPDHADYEKTRNWIRQLPDDGIGPRNLEIDFADLPTTRDERTYRDGLDYAQQRYAALAWDSQYDPQPAFTAGWMALLAARPDEAGNWFRVAIDREPSRPGPWLGLALLADDDGQALGALAIAENLASGSADAEANRGEARRAAPVLGIDLRRWDILVARARRMQADRHGDVLPEDVRALGAQALPPR